MGFGDAVRSCLHKYMTFSGRARRPEYWWFILATVLLGIAATLLDIVLGTGTAQGGLIASLMSLALLLPTLAVTWRRLHDVNRPGWFAFIGLIALMPLMAATALAAMQRDTGGVLVAGLMALGGLLGLGAMLYLLVLLVSRGTDGPNRFGPEPPPLRRMA
jgi:uncharacterized membrane protein YhaH (DUF805 family)